MSSNWFGISWPDLPSGSGGGGSSFGGDGQGAPGMGDLRAEEERQRQAAAETARLARQVVQAGLAGAVAGTAPPSMVQQWPVSRPYVAPEAPWRGYGEGPPTAPLVTAPPAWQGARNYGPPSAYVSAPPTAPPESPYRQYLPMVTGPAAQRYAPPGVQAAALAPGRVAALTAPPAGLGVVMAPPPAGGLAAPLTISSGAPTTTLALNAPLTQLNLSNATATPSAVQSQVVSPVLNAIGAAGKTIGAITSPVLGTAKRILFGTNPTRYTDAELAQLRQQAADPQTTPEQRAALQAAIEAELAIRQQITPAAPIDAAVLAYFQRLANDPQATPAQRTAAYQLIQQSEQARTGWETPEQRGVIRYPLYETGERLLPTLFQPRTAAEAKLRDERLTIKARLAAINAEKLQAVKEAEQRLYTGLNPQLFSKAQSDLARAQRELADVQNAVLPWGHTKQLASGNAEVRQLASRLDSLTMQVLEAHLDFAGRPTEYKRAFLSGPMEILEYEKNAPGWFQAVASLPVDPVMYSGIFTKPFGETIKLANAEKYLATPIEVAADGTRSVVSAETVIAKQAKSAARGWTFLGRSNPLGDMPRSMQSAAVKETDNMFRQMAQIGKQGGQATGEEFEQFMKEAIANPDSPRIAQMTGAVVKAGYEDVGPIGGLSQSLPWKRSVGVLRQVFGEVDAKTIAAGAERVANGEASIAKLTRKFEAARAAQVATEAAAPGVRAGELANLTADVADAQAEAARIQQTAAQQVALANERAVVARAAADAAQAAGKPITGLRDKALAAEQRLLKAQDTAAKTAAKAEQGITKAQKAVTDFEQLRTAEAARSTKQVAELEQRLTIGQQQLADMQAAAPKAGDIGWDKFKKILETVTTQTDDAAHYKALADFAAQYSDATTAIFGKSYMKGGKLVQGFPRTWLGVTKDFFYSIMAPLQMGWNPAFAIKNTSNNALTAWADGWNVFHHYDWRVQLWERWGVVPVEAGQGYGAAGEFGKTAAGAAATVRPLRFREIAQGTNLFQSPTLSSSGKVESRFSQGIVEDAIDKYWHQVWPKTVDKLLEPLKDLGVSQQAVDWAKSRAYQTMNPRELQALGQELAESGQLPPTVGVVKPRPPTVPPAASAAPPPVGPAPTTPGLALALPGDIQQAATQAGGGALLNQLNTIAKIADPVAAEAAVEVVRAGLQLTESTSQAITRVGALAQGALPQTPDALDALLKELNDLWQTHIANSTALMDQTRALDGTVSPEVYGQMWRDSFAIRDRARKEFYATLDNFYENRLPEIGFADSSIALKRKWLTDLNETWRQSGASLNRFWTGKYANKAARNAKWEYEYAERQRLFLAQQERDRAYQGEWNAAVEQVKAKLKANPPAAIEPPAAPSAAVSVAPSPKPSAPSAAPAPVASAAEALPAATTAVKEPWVERGKAIGISFDNAPYESNYWLQTRDEYVAQQVKPRTLYSLSYDQETALSDHEAYVETALTQGKPVPPEVLADYPDLAAKYPAAAAVAQAAPAVVAPTLTELNALFAEADITSAAEKKNFTNLYLEYKGKPQELASYTPEALDDSERVKLAEKLRARIAGELPTSAETQAIADAQQIAEARGAAPPPAPMEEVASTAEAVASGAPATAVSPLADTRDLAKVPTLFPMNSVKAGSVWEGVITEPGRFVSDGFILLDTEAADAKIVKELEAKAAKLRKRTATQADTLTKLWQPAVTEAQTEARFVGVNPETQLHKAYLLTPDGQEVALSGRLAALIHDATGFDRVMVSTPEKAIVFYKGERPVAMAMPMLGGDLPAGIFNYADLPTVTEQFARGGGGANKSLSGFTRPKFPLTPLTDLSAEDAERALLAKIAEAEQRLPVTAGKATPLAGSYQDSYTIKLPNGEITLHTREQATALRGQVKKIVSALRAESGQASVEAAGALPLTLYDAFNAQAQAAKPVLQRFSAWLKGAKTTPVQITPEEAQKIIQALDEQLMPAMGFNKALVNKMAVNARNFALGDYAAKKNIHDWLSYLFMYPFWYTFTYPNWFARIMQQPAFLAVYARYRQIVHDANLEWYRKYVDPNAKTLPPEYEGQIMFTLPNGSAIGAKLENAVMPLNSILTFFDRKELAKAPGGELYQQLSEWGPSVNTLLTYAYQKLLWDAGYKDAAAQIGSTYASLENLIRGVTNQLGIPGGVTPTQLLSKATGGWFAPWSQADYYITRRVPIYLLQLFEDGKLSLTNLQNAGYLKSGEAWTEAQRLEAQNAFLPELVRNVTSLGYKPRGEIQLNIDRMWADYYANKEQVAAADKTKAKEIKQAFYDQYPWFSIYTMARSTDERERLHSFTWLVLNRLPPGDGYTAAIKDAGLPQALIDKWYDTQKEYQFESWSAADYATWKAGIEKLAAEVLVPDADLKAEYKVVKDVKAQGQAAAAKALGVTVERWNQLQGERADIKASGDKAKLAAWDAAHPNMKAGWNASDAVTDQSALFNKYNAPGVTSTGLVLTPAVKAALALNDQMKTEGVQKFGAQAYQWLDDYYNSGPSGSAGRTAYRQQYPERYAALKPIWDYEAAFKAAHPEMAVLNTGTASTYTPSTYTPKTYTPYTPKSYSGGGGGGGGGGGSYTTTPAAPVAVTPTAAQQQQVANLTPAQYALLFQEVSSNDATFTPMVSVLFGADVLDAAQRYYAMTAEQQAAWKLANPALWQKLLRYLIWLLGQRATRSATLATLTPPPVPPAASVPLNAPVRAGVTLNPGISLNPPTPPAVSG